MSLKRIKPVLSYPAPNWFSMLSGAQQEYETAKDLIEKTGVFC